MPKFSFDPKTIGWPASQETDMLGPEPTGALKTLVFLRPGVEAFEQIARFTDIEWSKAFLNGPTDDVDPALRR
ncbi:MAG TPA: hypothetical protein DEO85_05080 [Maritimibacter sp.]|nr:hypothetical protein [Maritimibacter sp.]